MVKLTIIFFYVLAIPFVFAEDHYGESTQETRKPTKRSVVITPGVGFEFPRELLGPAVSTEVLHNNLASITPWHCSYSDGASHLTNLHALVSDALRKDETLRTKYRAEYDALAQRALAESVGNLDAIASVAFAYRHTAAGEKAALMAILGLRDRGENVAAALFAKGYLKDNPSPKVEKIAQSLVPGDKMGAALLDSWKEGEKDIPARLRLAVAYALAAEEIKALFTSAKGDACVHLETNSFKGLLAQYERNFPLADADKERFRSELAAFSKRYPISEKTAVSESTKRQWLSTPKSAKESLAAELFLHEGKSGVEPLMTLLDSKNKDSVVLGIHTLALLGEDAAPAIKKLETLIAQYDYKKHVGFRGIHQRRIAFFSINALSKIGQPAVPALTKLLESKSEAVRKNAADALRKMGL